MDFIETNWLLILVGLALAIAVAWYVFHAARRTRVTGTRRDVLDDGAAPAARNQALIDAPTAAVPQQPPAPAGLAGGGEAMVAAAYNRVAAAPGNDIARLKGVGPKLVAQMADLGVTSLSQVARWTEEDIDRIDAQLGRFQGRVRRDSWVEQAKLLTAGDDAAYAARFGNIS